MDIAYDHIQEDALSPDHDNGEQAGSQEQEQNARPRSQSNDLRTEFKEAYQALSSTAWGSRLGNFFGQVKKQSESYYEGAKNELSAASAEASKGWSGFMGRARTLSPDEETTVPTPGQTPTAEATNSVPTSSVPESLPADIIKEAETMLSRFRSDAAVKLEQIRKAEDAADAALERFGSNIMSFLKDAVTVAPPAVDEGGSAKREVLFESRDAEGKRVVHATRFDAQLHVIHSRSASFMEDPVSSDFAGWKRSFDIEKKTDAIAQDLDKYDELRRSMDKLVPEQVSYPDFWTRYYFLRNIVEAEEQKRRELLKGTQAEEEEVGWGDDDDVDEENQQGTPKIKAISELGSSTPTISGSGDTSLQHLKPNEPRRSNEQSVADSDASYDIVSGATSRSPGSPREEKEAVDKTKTIKTTDDSDDEDWE